jgi:hypothetical protein
MLNILIACLMLAALIFLNRATRKPVIANAAGRYHLRMNKLYSLAGILGTLTGLGLVLMIIFRGSADTTAIVLLAVILTVFWGVGITCLMYYYNYQVTFDDTSITVTTAFRKTTTIRWEDITSASPNGLSNVITLMTAADKVRIHQHLVGLKHFTDKLEVKKGWTLPPTGPTRGL